ncbi:hypothetical protein ODJ79_13160 [Actinoplanes sp. KI2]|uniref:hypothetical protein n=1 Tax=Actinoplanes sp. KI2 TaxID=2983315 RepID=UPI0021D5F844|nr:hypothetical protein [Actinoplanes sp. KI2]MCU7724669.1 hypothetical protein [Actinoplanes sp. KI2]
MDSLPAAGTVRRTVRVAVALVVGQALLVGLIGWLTLGRAGGAGGKVDAMAAPPAARPPTGAGRHVQPPTSPGRSAASPATTTRATHRKAVPVHVPLAPPARPPQPPPPRPAQPPPPAIAVPALPAPAPTVVATTVVPPALVPVVPPAPSASFGPVVVGDPCSPEGAYAFTADSVLVRCTRTSHHRLLWKIV